MSNPPPSYANTNLKCLISSCVFNSLIASVQKKEAEEEEPPVSVKRVQVGVEQEEEEEVAADP